MNQKTLLRICGTIMALSGLVILFSTLFPILSYEWYAAQKYPTLISPLVDTETAQYKFDNRDYTRASNWVSGVNAEFVSEEVKYFTVSIPKLFIDNATVAIGGEDLSENLIQFPGTALPGKVGNSVIFGHSILPTFYDPENYLAIFSTLDKLKSGDKVFVNYDGITYTYSVEDMFEVKPTDLEILAQSKGASYLSLVTCSPMGHPLKPKRLIVRAKLIPTTSADANIGN